MRFVTVTGALIIIIGWIVFVEFDQLVEKKRRSILDRVKHSPFWVMTISLMPLGILVHIFGTLIQMEFLRLFGTLLIFLQALIVAIFFWRYKRWKSIFLFIVIFILGFLQALVYV